MIAQTAPQHPLTEPIARLAGQLLGSARSSSPIDALVVAEALHCSPAIVVTSDPNDIRQLLGDHPGVTIEAI